jgi:hypothetical protein
MMLHSRTCRLGGGLTVADCGVSGTEFLEGESSALSKECKGMPLLETPDESLGLLSDV